MGRTPGGTELSVRARPASLSTVDGTRTARLREPSAVPAFLRLRPLDRDVFAEYDLLVTPTLSTTGMGLDTGRGTDWERALTQPFDWIGHRATSVPAGPTDGLPSGLQVVGRRYADGDVFAAAGGTERERPWNHRYPE